MKNKWSISLLLSLLMVAGCKNDDNSSSISSTSKSSVISSQTSNDVSTTSKDSSNHGNTNTSSDKSSHSSNTGNDSSNKPSSDNSSTTSSSSSGSSTGSSNNSSSNNNDKPIINKKYDVSIKFEEEAAWFKYYLEWSDDSLDINNIKAVGAIDGTIEFSHFLVSEKIDNDNNNLEYGFAFMSADFLTGNHTINVIVQTLDGKFYSIQTSFSKNITTDATIYGTSLNEVISRSITLDANGGTCDASTLLIIDGYAIGSLPTPTKDNYNFLGWYSSLENGERIDSSTIVSNSLTTIYALWEEKSSDQVYTSSITLNKDAAWFKYFLSWSDDKYDVESIYSVSSINGSLTFSHTLDVQEIYNDSNKLQYGFAFNGADFINPGTYVFTVIIKTTSGNFYAITTSFEGANGGEAFINSTIIEETETIDIALDANEGSIDIESIKAIANNGIGTLPTPTRDGYRFSGWYTQREGGDRISASTTFSESTTIYAQWVEIIEGTNNALPIDTSRSKVEGAGVFIYFTDNNILTNISKDDISITLNSVTTDFEGYKTYETSITYNGIVHTDGCIYFLISAGLGLQNGYYFDFDFTISLTASNGEYYESNIIFRNNTPYSLDGTLI